MYTYIDIVRLTPDSLKLKLDILLDNEEQIRLSKFTEVYFLFVINLIPPTKENYRKGRGMHCVKILLT